MCAQLLPQEILAPFVTGFDESTGEFIANIPKEIIEHLNSPHFCEPLNDNIMPGSTKFNLIPTHAGGKDAELSVDKLVEQQFSGPKWQEQVNKVLMEKGLVQNSRETNEDAPSFVRFGRDDDLYTVRVENLPDNEGRDDIADLLHEAGCHYFTKVIVPFDEETGTYRRTGFIKFQRLRWAIKFIQDYQSVKAGNMLLSFKLSA